MTTIVITATKFCASGGHAHVSVTGAKTYALDVDVAPFSDPVTDEEAAAFIKVIAKMAKAGRTNAQAAALLQTGVTVTV
jgi:hypothetical protein